METEQDLLKSIESKLDILIALTRLSNRTAIDSFSASIRADPVYNKILELTETPTTYGNLSKSVAEATSTSEITVKRKLADLRSMGVINVRKGGGNAFYENSGVLG
jgi:DNA-binding transcriptional ArsR family regulator